MRPAVVPSRGAPLEIRNLPVRVSIHGQVVVQIRASGLCHTDIHAGIRPVTAQGRVPWLSWFTALSPQSPRSRLAVGTSKGRQPNCALLDTGSALQS